MYWSENPRVPDLSSQGYDNSSTYISIVWEKKSLAPSPAKQVEYIDKNRGLNANRYC
jgi:hypothetical protein